MPRVKGRGKKLRTRTVKISKNKYIHVDVYSKAGPRGGHTVAGPVRTEKKKSKS